MDRGARLDNQVKTSARASNSELVDVPLCRCNLDSCDECRLHALIAMLRESVRMYLGKLAPAESKLIDDLYAEFSKTARSTA